MSYANLRAYRNARDPKFKNVQHLFEDVEQPRPGEDPLASVDDLDLKGSPAAQTVSVALPRESSEPLRHSDGVPDNSDEPDQSGEWDPQRHREPEFEHLTEQDGLDISSDIFLSSDDDDDGDDRMDADAGDDRMMDSLLNAAVEQDDAVKFVRAMRQTKKRKPNSENGSVRAGDRHSSHCESKPRTADPRAAPAVHAVTGPDATFLEVYGGASFCKEAETSRRNLNLKGLGALDLRTLKPDGTP